MIRKKKNNIIYHILTLLGGILMLYPLIWMLMSSFKETNTIINTATQLFPEVVTFDNYQNGWRHSYREKDGILELVLLRLFLFRLIPYFFRQLKCRPSFWPSYIKGNVGENICDFFLCHSMCFCILQMIDQRGIGDP